ncbi:hypothetical protein RvY_14243 [Ramazzottius varieornatus]|uniref:Uncharacterized protein n=1 Tax=Ramazzottius varieornatus TaxID=947166 RepID=A0A1D1VXX4_RAMVA|nr:hypothetical protein RvY_14243 [Ramazzottius varieornatus]
MYNKRAEKALKPDTSNCQHKRALRHHQCEMSADKRSGQPLIVMSSASNGNTPDTIAQPAAAPLFPVDLAVA